MRALVDEFLVDRMHLISFLAGEIVEEQELGRVIARVDDWTLFDVRGDTDVEAAHRFDFLQRTNAGEQLCKVFLGARILQPEEDVMDELRIRRAARSAGSARASGGGHCTGGKKCATRSHAHEPRPS